MYNILNIQYQTHPEENLPDYITAPPCSLIHSSVNTLTQAYLMAVIMHSYCVNLY